MSDFRTLKDIPDVSGKKVLVRSELNTPIENGAVADDYRIEKALPTLEWLKERGAKVIVIAHLGRKPEDTLEPVYEVLKRKLPNTKFVKDVVGDMAKKAVAELENGEVLLLENVRSNAGEKENNEEFARKLAELADYYVDDAFGATHRVHASIVGVPAVIPGFAGLLLERELRELEEGLNPSHPSLFILGGAKFDTKEPLLEAILNRYDTIFVGGALANDFLKAEGLNIGKSLVSDSSPDKVVELLSSGKIMLPADAVVERDGVVLTKSADSVMQEDKIVDVGPESVTELGVRIAHAKFILWNGPLGFYEGGYVTSTKSVAELVADADGRSVIGGGDTVASIRELSLEDKMDFISTGGGAMLDYLVDGILPGVEALKNSPNV